MTTPANWLGPIAKFTADELPVPRGRNKTQAIKDALREMTPGTKRELTVYRKNSINECISVVREQTGYSYSLKTVDSQAGKYIVFCFQLEDL